MAVEQGATDRRLGAAAVAFSIGTASYWLFLGLNEQAVREHHRTAVGAAEQQHGGGTAGIGAAGEAGRSMIDLSETGESLAADARRSFRWTSQIPKAGRAAAIASGFIARGARADDRVGVDVDVDEGEEPTRARGTMLDEHDEREGGQGTRHRSAVEPRYRPGACLSFDYLTLLDRCGKSGTKGESYRTSIPL